MCILSLSLIDSSVQCANSLNKYIQNLTNNKDEINMVSDDDDDDDDVTPWYYHVMTYNSIHHVLIYTFFYQFLYQFLSL